jgi:uncharacterized protein YoaH (UPF0181 family)
MDERPPGGPELPGPGEGEDAAALDDGTPAGPGPAADDPVARALAAEAAEIRRLVDEGAGSPEAIRELAARLREHREREEALWRAEVRPALVKQGRGRLRGTRPAGEAPRDDRPASTLWLGVGLLALVLIVVVAANTSIWLLLLPVVALLVWAWWQGRDAPPS